MIQVLSLIFLSGGISFAQDSIPIHYQGIFAYDKKIEAQISDIFETYLLYGSIDYRQIKKQIDSDPHFASSLAIASNKVIPEKTHSLLLQAFPKSPLLSAIKNEKKAQRLVPLHYRIVEDRKEKNPGIFYERGTHRVQMSLEKVAPGNWLAWYLHENLHFLDPFLRSSEKSVSDSTRINQISTWVRNGHSELTDSEEHLLDSYFSELTDLSIKAEFRAWLVTSLFVQKMLLNKQLRLIPPSLAFLTEAGFGKEVLSTNQLKELWWNKLKLGFYVESTGLFTEPWLNRRLQSYVDRLDPLNVPLEGLIELVQAAD